MKMKNEGFTLVELMVTILVMAVITMIAAPSFSKILAKQKLNSNTQDLISTLSKARSQAVLLRQNTTVHLSTGTENDLNYYWQLADNNSITSPSVITEIVFARDGSISSGMDTSVDFIICNSKTGTTRVFALTRMGSIYNKNEGTC
ncbi:prepilin-type N-terminal cleavage/methylation domain-containing protein [Acinetobacter wuhouensis]|uniref:Type II secretion system protein H n=1 Tax=Acinetobacter wuhouensis TaxID=1879050 RepID=A0A385C016_9GAMM|nr:GspH/FimT family pseudopilin [Acinetobacter wuhouensis]AXQ20998.1 prepilin-type N-terminal cleavage/methylation domain-containing protein [Acinetobacter wuhouensis]RZG49121.1 prepilin-type N-terminal cleavage/methylation domain-containing protein [Acinetobacter wuhouensis]